MAVGDRLSAIGKTHEATIPIALGFLSGREDLKTP
jgi:hypothetical protein